MLKCNSFCISILGGKDSVLHPVSRLLRERGRQCGVVGRQLEGVRKEIGMKSFSTLKYYATVT